MAATEAPTIEVANTRSRTTVNGAAVTFSRADLASLAASYDRRKDPAPLVIDTPGMDDPAYGWAKGLHLDGDALLATTERVMPAFAELVRAGKYRKVAASLYPPGSKVSPNPKAWCLRHVSFVGAVPPPFPFQTLQAAFASGRGAGGTVAIELPALLTQRTPSVSLTEGIPYAEARRRERLAASLADLARLAQDPLTKRRVETVARATELQAERPGMTFGDAMAQAKLLVAARLPQ
jgi:hypothetical protein